MLSDGVTARADSCGGSPQDDPTKYIFNVNRLWRSAMFTPHYSNVFKGICLLTLLSNSLLNAESVEFNKSYPVSQNTYLELKSAQVNIEAQANIGEKENNVVSMRFRGNGTCELVEKISDNSVKLAVQDKSQSLPWYKKIFSMSSDDCMGTLTVSTPAHLIFNVRTLSGTIKLDRIEHIAEVVSVSGDINISAFAIDNADAIQTVSGDISILSSSVMSKLIKTVSGDIKIATNALKSEITSTSGDITVTTQQSGSHVFVKNVSGNMLFTILETPNSSDAKIDFKTVSGDIMVKLPGSVAAQVDTKTVSGARDIGIKTDEISNLKLSAKSVSGNIAVLPL